MDLRHAAGIVGIGVMLSGCAGGPPRSSGSSTIPTANATISTHEPTATAAARRVESVIPYCDEVPRVSAPADAYRDTPIYVGNDQPTELIRAWAADKPGIQSLWVDRDHLGWITVSFTVDADVRQAELEAEFPDIGVVAVQVDWTNAELRALQQRVSDELGPLFGPASWPSEQQGVVGIGVGVLWPERVAAIEARFAGERVCIEGTHPDDAPPRGPQAPDGDGWRLLADARDTGQPFRTGIAYDAASYLGLWNEIGLDAEAPAVDFDAEVAIWFGAVYGSSCPNLRFDAVVTDAERGLVYAEIVLVDAPPVCTSDARAHAYVVALDRAKLPAPPFAIQLGDSGPPPGFPGERTVVEADLARPGAVAGPGEVHPDASLAEPEPYIVETGGIVEPDFAVGYRMDVACGIEWLGELNGLAWRIAPGDAAGADVPAAWQPDVDATGHLVVQVTMQAGPDPRLSAVANAHAVEYRPTSDEMPACR